MENILIVLDLSWLDRTDLIIVHLDCMRSMQYNSTSNILYECEHIFFFFVTRRHLSQSNRKRKSYVFFIRKMENSFTFFIVGWHWPAFLIVYLFIKIMLERTSRENKIKWEIKRSRTVDDVAGMMTVAHFALHSFEIFWTDFFVN